MKKLVIIPGGFHPYHAGHKALYDAAVDAFPTADIYVAATADTSTRPFPFKVKQKLAQLAGIPPHRFIQVKSPFRAEEITQHYDPQDTQLIFVRSEKDRNQQPQAGGVKKDGSLAYLQPYKRTGRDPMAKHGYMTYLPTVQFGPGMTSATEIRSKWPGMGEDEKISFVQSVYPNTVGNEKLTKNIVNILDTTMSESKQTLPVEDDIDEGAILVNNPERGFEIRPAGGMGTWNEDSLRSSLAGQLRDIVEQLKWGRYRNIEHLLYKNGAMEAKIRALARFEDFKEKQGRRPVAKGREIDIGESDYIEEKNH